ncbi:MULTISPECIES: 50S ribosomal protein L23 [unclassified Spirosoma]|uniref:50S ribosomal protein L23 n=1 Tax=unclassified Spirosoma TaxID=2621999 RepID=UPI0009637997|nr:MULTISPECIES: 50S ribosomal protein L23 [unclassified Spirosoma]MBN8822743.1 50S ribosomal protein L23 [Spirosoma sp.]OJW79954.1 MAG: 50S ribosomal protein L23 [Spirosoma sp. 48-14]
MSVLKRPIVTEKMTGLNKQGKYAFEVDLKANKLEIGKAIEKMYGVNVEAVNTIRTFGKRRSKNINGRIVSGKTPTTKKAIVTVAEGEVIDIYADL